MALLHKSHEGSNDDRSGVDNAAKTLLANIRFLSVDNPIRTVVLTSAIPNEGKTFISINLARAMATSGMRTLLVECDMRRRSVAHTIGTHAQNGIYSVMSGEVKLQDAVAPTSTPNLYFLDAEPHIPNPSDLLNTKRFTELVQILRNTYDYVVFDTPPVCAFVDAAVLGSKVDALFMVVRKGHTHKAELERASEQLKAANAPLSGVVMNFCERTSSEYYYEYYYKEGERHRRRRGSSSQMPPLPLTAESPFDTPESELRRERSRGAEQQLQAPQSWDNTPDLDLLGATGSIRKPASSTGGPARVRQQPRPVRQERPTQTPPQPVRPQGGQSLRTRVPSIGETNILSREALAERQRQLDTSVDPVDSTQQ